MRMLPGLVLVVALASAACTTRAPTVSPAPEGPRAPSPVPVATSAALTPGPAPAVSPAEAAILLARAEKCLADATCTEDANALYRRADDGGAKGLSCFRFYYGIGIAKDLPRARACFERDVAGVRCADSLPSLDLERDFLATMLIDAQGGPAEPARVDPLFSGCFDGVAGSTALEDLQRRIRQNRGSEPIDYCKDIAFSTRSINECLRMDRARVAAERVRVHRLLLPRLDAEGWRLAAKARDTWTDFAEKEGYVASDMYRGGTMSSNAFGFCQHQLERRRAAALARFFDYKPSRGAHPAQAERDLDKAYHEACSYDAARAKLCTAARQAWTAYRDAEVALYVRVHGALSEKQVAADVKATLARQYQADLEEMMRP